MDKVIEGKAFVNNEIQHVCIGISNGKITQIKKTLRGDEHIKVNRGLLLPAGVDVHVHFRDPGQTHKEDFYTGSLSAVFGGTTCVFDMPNTLPAVVSESTIKDKHDIVSKKSVIDYGLGLGITSKNYEEVAKLSRFCQGFKIFLGSSTNALVLPSEKLSVVFQLLKDCNKPVFVHAEDEQCLKQYSTIEKSLKDHVSSRPAECELRSIKHVLFASQQATQTYHSFTIQASTTRASYKLIVFNKHIPTQQHH